MDTEEGPLAAAEAAVRPRIGKRRAFLQWHVDVMYDDYAIYLYVAGVGRLRIGVQAYHDGKWDGVYHLYETRTGREWETRDLADVVAAADRLLDAGEAAGGEFDAFTERFARLIDPQSSL